MSGDATMEDAPTGWRESAPEPGRELRRDREKRLKIRCWRRGTREMDLILGRFADARLPALTDEELDAFEALIREDDGRIYKWIAGAEPAPEAHAEMIQAIRTADTAHP